MSIAANETQSIPKSSRSASPEQDSHFDNPQPGIMDASPAAPGSKTLGEEIPLETNKNLVDTVTDKIRGESMSLPPDSPNNNQQSSLLKSSNSHSGSEGDSSDKEHSRKRKLSSRSSTANEAAVRLHPKRPKESDVPEREEDSEDALHPSESATTPKPVQVFGFGSFASTKSPFATGQQNISAARPGSPHNDHQQARPNPKKTEPLAPDGPSPSVALVGAQSAQPSLTSGSTGFAAFASASPFKRPSANISSSVVSSSEQRDSLAGPVRRSKSPVGKHQAFGQYSTGISRFGNLVARKATHDDGSVQQSNEVQSRLEETAEFEDMLKSKGEETINQSTIKPDIAEITHNTGEEDDLTIFQTRAKLYTQDETFAYKERGTGLLKVNVRRSDGEGARIVMRAEGVLRLILNMSLYPGLICELGPDPKFIKIAEITAHERRLHAIKVGNAKLAQELYDHLMENTPDQKINSPKEVAV